MLTVKKATAKSLFIRAVAASLIGVGGANACDFCAVYSSIESKGGSKGSYNIGAAYQFTHYESNIKPVGRADLPGQHLESNITQLFANYNVTDHLSAQINIPLIYRDFRRVVNGQVEDGSESGLGDIALLVRYEAVRTHKKDSSLAWELFGGLKLPTGDADRLKEETDFFEPRIFARHGNTADGALVGGDDLALGTGSTDWIIGSSLFLQQNNFFLSGSAQYAIRQEGDFDYHYGNDLQWHVGPGYYLILEDDRTLSLRLRLSGEDKEKDRINSQTLEGSEDNRVYAGPELSYSIREQWNLSLATDFAVETEDSANGVTPRYRTLAVVSYKP